MSVMETLKAVKEEEAVALSGVLVAVQTFLEEVRASFPLFSLSVGFFFTI